MTLHMKFLRVPGVLVRAGKDPNRCAGYGTHVLWKVEEREDMCEALRDAVREATRWMFSEDVHRLYPGDWCTGRVQVLGVKKDD